MTSEHALGPTRRSSASSPSAVFLKNGAVTSPAPLSAGRTLLRMLPEVICRAARPRKRQHPPDGPRRVLRLFVAFTYKSLTVVSDGSRPLAGTAAGRSPFGRWLLTADPELLTGADAGGRAEQLAADGLTLQEPRAGKGRATMKRRVGAEHPDGHDLGLAATGHLRGSLASGQGASLGLRNVEVDDADVEAFIAGQRSRNRDVDSSATRHCRRWPDLNRPRRCAGRYRDGEEDHDKAQQCHKARNQSKAEHRSPPSQDARAMDACRLNQAAEGAERFSTRSDYPTQTRRR